MGIFNSTRDHYTLVLKDELLYFVIVLSKALAYNKTDFFFQTIELL